MPVRHQIALLLLSFALSTTGAAQDQKIDSGCGTNLGNVSQSNVTINIDCGNQKGSALSFYYSRLFGAYEVPLLMDIIPQRNFAPHESWDEYIKYNDFAGDEAVVHKRLYRFRNAFPYKDSHPIPTPIWTDIAGIDDAARTIGWIASSGLRSERVCFFISPFIDGGSGADYRELKEYMHGKPEESCGPVIKRFDRRVGFTFLIIQNVSSEAIDDVTFHFRQSYVSQPFKIEYAYDDARDLKLLADKAPATGDALANLIARFGRAREAEINLADHPLENKFVARLEPGQKLIALLNVYIANAKNLPAAYLYGIYDFEEVTYNLRGVANRVQVRPPSRENAARVPVPFGWFLQ